MIRQRLRKADDRRGAVAAEFAMVAPLLLTMLLGVFETARVMDIQNQMATAAREGVRLAAMDRAEMDLHGKSTNEKIIEDIRNFLDSSGLPADDIDIEITDADDSDVDFDLDDPDNDLELFQVRVELPYSDVLGCCTPGDFVLTANLTFRNARAAIVQ